MSFSDIHNSVDQLLSLDGEPLDFNEDFQIAFHLMEDTDKFIFVTGKAGTGKSTLLKYFNEFTQKQAILLAPTGVAALNIGGMTIHKFFRFPPRPLTEEDIIGHYNNELYQLVDTIVIDEISMVRADLLDGIDQALRARRGEYEKPFGGVQLIFFGDLFQLPPIVDHEEEARLFGINYESPWCFDAKVFAEIELHVIELKKVYRHIDSNFINLLDAIRRNKILPNQLETINHRVGYEFDEQIKLPIILTCTNSRADSINTQKLAQIHEPLYQFPGRIEGDFPKKSLPTNILLQLKVGSQIMMVKNDPEYRWVNGSIGKIHSLENEMIKVEFFRDRHIEVYEVKIASWEILKYHYDYSSARIVSEVIGEFKQYPIKLAWAITIHKSQGLTYDHVIIDFEKGTFASGQAYVAMSRSRSLDGISLKRPIKLDDIKTDPSVNRFIQAIPSSGIINQRPTPKSACDESVSHQLPTLQERFEQVANPKDSRDEHSAVQSAPKSDFSPITQIFELPVLPTVINPVPKEKILPPGPLETPEHQSIPLLNWKAIALLGVLIMVVTLLWINASNQKNSFIPPVPTPSLAKPINTVPSMRTTDSAAIQPTATKIQHSAAPFSTLAPRCQKWSDVSLEDKGTKMCVYGKVTDVYQEGEISYLKFRNSIGDFFAISYDGKSLEDFMGKCIEFEGQIEQIGSSPVIVLTNHSNLALCQSDISE